MVGKTKIIAVRHCEAVGNSERIFCGRLDSDITENGMLQLESLAERMKNVHIDAIYSSPLKRAVKTAEAINKYHNLKINTENDLMEINGGVWEGKKWASFPKLYPQDSYNWNIRPCDFAPENGESMRELYDRIWKAVLLIAEKNRGRTVCAVSHGCAIRNLICRAKNWEIERLNEIEWCDNTAVNVIEFDENMNPKLTTENDSSHISSEISTFAKQSWWKKENRDKLIFE